MKITTPIVLIRGLFREQRHWGIFPALLAKTFPDAKIICVDIPGTGQRYREPSPTSIESMVDKIRAEFEGQIYVNIIAISMGGMIGLQWATMYPKEINSLTCINTSAANFSKFYHRLLAKNYFTILKTLFVGVRKREQIIYKLLSNRPEDINVINNWVAYAQQYPVSNINFFRQLWAAFKFTIDKQVNCRVLFISSVCDNLVSHEASKAIAQQWEVQLLINLHDGHDIALDNPQWLCDNVEGFITRCLTKKSR
ncbi:alpha/beta fold hydrolase [Psychromonas sp.]|uniref:alpha/beta fold hydrolase n=1 Tax=Psychromonas sp. TaxID=1884585 RepID=UPI003562DA82